MSGMEGQLAVVIPTRNRPAHLARALNALELQKRRPDVIVVVDASDRPQSVAVRDICDRMVVPTTVLPAKRPSLTGQRNEGVDHVLKMAPGVAVIQFLDDDVIPAPDYLEKVTAILTADVSHTIGGVSGVTEHTSARASSRYYAYMRFFLLHGTKPGTVLPSGINIPVPRDSSELVDSQWLIGCSAYRAQVCRSLRFWEGQLGYVLFEDVEFSLRVGRGWRLIVDPGARLWHAQASTQDEKNLEPLARQFVRNRYHVVTVCLQVPGRRLAYWWSTLGYLLFLSLKVATGRVDARLRLRGAWRGLVDILFRRI